MLHKLILPLLFLTFLTEAQTSLQTVIQKGHSAAVKSVAIDKSGKYLATGSRDRSVKLWDLEKGIEIRSFLGHEYTVNSLQFSTSGKYLISGSADNTAKLWDVVTGKEIFSTPKQNKYITDVAIAPNEKYIAVAGYNDNLQVYEIPSGKLIKEIPVNSEQGTGYGIDIEFSEDGKYLAVGEDDKTARVFRTEKWDSLYTFKPAEGWCGGCPTFVAFSKDGKYLAKLSRKEKLKIFDLQTGKKIKETGIEVDEIAGLKYSNDGKRILVAAEKKITEYEAGSGKIINTINIPDDKGELNEIIYNADESEVICAFGKNIAISFNLKTGKESRVYKGIINLQDAGGLNYDPDNYRESYIAKYLRLKNPLVLTNDNKNFITGKTGTKSVMWSLETGSPIRFFSEHAKAVVCMDISKDGKLLATGDGSGEVNIWQISNGKKIKTFKGHREPLFEVKFNRDASQLITTSWDAYMAIWDIDSGEKLSFFDLENASVYSASFSPDGLYLVTGRLDKSLEMREPDSKKVVRNFTGHTDVVSSIEFGPEKYKLLTASWDGSSRIWDISTGMMLQKFRANTRALHVAIFFPDGKKIATAGDDRMIRIYDAQTGKLTLSLAGHQAEITSLKISTDGKTLLSYSLDGVLKCWNLEKGKEFYEHIHINESEWMARTPDGFFNATGQARTSIHFVNGLEIYSPEQFFEEYYKPDLIPQLFKKKGEKNDRTMGLEERLQTSPPPSVKIAAFLHENGKSADVSIKIIDNGGGIADLKVMHNGKILPFNSPELGQPAKKGNEIYIKTEVPLIKGSNIFSAVALSTGKVESAPVETQLFAETGENTASCYIFAIGINKYKNPSLTLNYAREDAASFVQSMSQNQKGLYKKVNVITLYDENATKQNIIDTLTSLGSKISINDIFILYYAGHGGISGDKFYFIPSECIRLYEDKLLEKSAIEATEIQEKLKQIKALKQVIIMDACHSGGAVEMIAMRGSMEEKAIAQLSRSAGIHVLASAGAEQGAKELSQLKHGLFTYVLLKALNGEADGSPKDGKITVYEVKSYIDDQVPELNKELNGKLQFPYTFSKGQDFPIIVK